MRKIKYMIIAAVMIFVSLSNVSAGSLSVQTTKGSCTQQSVGFYDLRNGLMYVDVVCQANSSFYMLYLFEGETDFYKCPSEDCTYVSSVQGYSNSPYQGVSITGSKTHSTVLKNYSYFDSYKGFYLPDTYPVAFKSTSFYYGPYPNTNVTPIINISTSGQYWFTIQLTVLPGNQSSTIQSAYDSANTDQKLDDMKDSIDDLNDSITSTEGPDIDGLGDTSGWLPVGPVDSILNLPFLMLNSLFDSLSSTCEPVVLPLPFVDKDLELSCINSIYAKIGNLSLWVDSIGLIISGLILYKYLLSLYQWVDDTLSFRENNLNNTEQWGGI